jgi:heptaprenyl diphosphate synthase
MRLADIYRSLKSDLDYIEKDLEQSITTEDPILHQTSSHLLKAGGKRIRPVFVLLAGKYGEYDIEDLKFVAASLELIHMATLVHDDVIDNAETRRGQQTVKARWGNQLAMYTGDYVIAEGLLKITELGIPRVHQILSRAIVQMVVGEIEQIREFDSLDQSLRDYLHRIKRKTALLIAVSCQLGAIVSKAPEPAVRALYNYGYHVGMAFQITDDILDFIGNEKKLGKPAGSDLRQGNITLPAIYCLQDPVIGAEVRQLISSFRTNEELSASEKERAIKEAIRLIGTSEGIHYAKRLADRYIRKALMWLDQLPHNQASKLLHEIAYLIGKREA